MKFGRNSNFYDMFVETSRKTVEAAKKLYDLMTDYTDVEAKISGIEEMEHQCDHQIHSILQVLNKTFITPIDREDLYLIAKELDNITDAIEATAHRFRMFNVKSITPDAVRLGKLIIECTSELTNVMLELKNMNKNDELNKKVIEVNRIEDEGDDIFRNAVTQLFSNPHENPVDVIKWKEIYELLENTLDACEDVANVIEGVVMKNA